MLFSLSHNGLGKPLANFETPFVPFLPSIPWYNSALLPHPSHLQLLHSRTGLSNHPIPHLLDKSLELSVVYYCYCVASPMTKYANHYRRTNAHTTAIQYAIRLTSCGTDSDHSTRYYRLRLKECGYLTILVTTPSVINGNTNTTHNMRSLILCTCMQPYTYYIEYNTNYT